MVKLCLLCHRGYKESQDLELQEVFDLVTDRGLNLWDTADSYGRAKSTIIPSCLYRIHWLAQNGSCTEGYEYLHDRSFIDTKIDMRMVCLLQGLDVSMAGVRCCLDSLQMSMLALRSRGPTFALQQSLLHTLGGQLCSPISLSGAIIYSIVSILWSLNWALTLSVRV